MPRYLVLQLIHPAARVLIQTTRRAILGLRERALDGCLPARLRRFQFTCKLPVQGRLRRRQRGCYLLLNLLGRGEQRLTLGRRRFFRPLRRFLKGLCRRLHARNNFCFQLLCLSVQPGGCFLCFLESGSQSFR